MASNSFDFSADMKAPKKTNWIGRTLNKSQSEPLYDTSVVVQEFTPNPNWKLPQISPSKIYDLPMFNFRATNLIRYASINATINITQPVYQIPLIKPEYVQWGLEKGYKYVLLGPI